MSAVHCAEAVGRLAAAWGRELVIFEPSLSEELNSSDSSGVTTTLKKEVKRDSAIIRVTTTLNKERWCCN